MSLFRELKRRNVFRVGAAYVVVAWLIIQVVETIFPAFGFDDSAIRIATIVLAIGLIPTMIIAWAFELTPEGLKKESEVDRSQSITSHTGKKLDRMIIVVLALALGYFAFDKFVLDPQRDASQEEALAEQVEEARQEGRTEALIESYGEKSIAVLAFDDMSQAGDQEYLSDGIAEELLNLLAKIPDLRVISRSSAFSFKGQNLELTEIARRLNVNHILEGSVRKAGDQVRITAQLIEARSDTHLWSETYDRTLDNVFAIQDEIAAEVVAQLKITLLGDVPHVKEVDPEAYALFLQARHLARQGTPEGFDQSNALYQQAIDLDPDYAAPLAELSRNYTNQLFLGLLPPAETIPLIQEFAERALAIDPDFADAYGALSRIAMGIDNDLVLSAQHLQRALQLEPANIQVLAEAPILLHLLGRIEESIAVLEYVSTRDPVNPVPHANLAFTLLDVGRWDDAIASAQTAIKLSPDFVGARYPIGAALLFKGEYEPALAEFAQEEDEEYRVKGTTLALYALGRLEEYEASLESLIEGWGEHWPSEIAHVYAWVGDADSAFEWLDKAIAQNEQGLAQQFAQHYYKPILDDPRWAEFLEASGSSPEQQAAIEFEVQLPK